MNIRNGKVWSLLGGCLVIVYLTMAFISYQVIQLDYTERVRASQSEQQKKVNFALWKMDTALLAMISEEFSRPLYYLPKNVQEINDQQRLLDFFSLSPDSIQDDSSYVQLHFQLHPKNDLRSPQLLQEQWPQKQQVKKKVGKIGPVWPLLVQNTNTETNIVLESTPNTQTREAPKKSTTVAGLEESSSGKERTELQQAGEKLLNLVTYQKFYEYLNEYKGQEGELVRYKPLEGKLWNFNENNNENKELIHQQGITTNSSPQLQKGQQIGKSNLKQQQLEANMVRNKVIKANQDQRLQTQQSYSRGRREQGERTASHQEQQRTNSNGDFLAEENIYEFENYFSNTAPPFSSNGILSQEQTLHREKDGWRFLDSKGNDSRYLEVIEGGYQAFWIEGELFIAKLVSLGTEDFIQGCWLNWDKLKESLRSYYQEDLPNGDLVSIGKSRGQEHLPILATLPVQLVAPSKEMISRSLTPIQTSLLAVWACLLLSSFAIVYLTNGTLKQSDRRANFVSTVTHELRTPLTTFRMYTEMLQNNMVPKEEVPRYIQTLETESSRLIHLVENVLAYAQLERKKRRVPLEKMRVSELLETFTSRLQNRAEEAHLTFEVIGAEETGQLLLTTDKVAVEQILFNLIDNGCKYASHANPKKIELYLEHEIANQRLLFRIQDYGPGVDYREVKNLFSPFIKGCQHQAAEFTGIGLGLALSKRLAKKISGELICHPAEKGACFVLALPCQVDDTNSGNEKH
ncbi:MAG: HAMP domain-containing histidine kinase [Pirellulaceae bacterium]|nr:HAMP domain-containing histidine kinase [Pirellulaceae bacterium]